MITFKLVHSQRYGTGYSMVWAAVGAEKGTVPEVTLHEYEGTRRWRARLYSRDDTHSAAQEVLAILDREIATLQQMAAFVRQKEAEFAGPPETLGERLKRLRKAQGVSLGSIAEAAAISLSFLSQLERGEKKRMGWDKFQSLARALDVTMDELADGLAEDPA